VLRHARALLSSTPQGTCDYLVEPGVVQPQRWRPEPGTLSPPLVTAWCGVARKR
jgi:hypothetical protein